MKNLTKVLTAALTLILTCALLLSAACADAPVTGGWTPAESTELTGGRTAVFDKGMEKLVGVHYEPLAYLASQVVAGTNHCFLCRATVVYPGAQPYYALVYLYEDLAGNVSVLNIAPLDLGALAETADAE